MPVVKIEYNKIKVDERLLTALIQHLNQSVAASIGRPSSDVAIYTFPYEHTVNGATIEVYVEIGSKSIKGSKEEMLAKITADYSKFKTTHQVQVDANLSVVEMNWCFNLSQ
jgi:hypothetical protein